MTEAGEALRHATITVIGRSVGTISNDSGEFKLNIPKDFLSDTLRISFLGFENFNGTVKDIESNRNLLVKMKIKNHLLEELAIEDKRITSTEIMDSVKKNIGKNYATNPFVLEGFFRQFSKRNDRYFELMEAAISIHDEGYPTSKVSVSKRGETVYLREVRRFSEEKAQKKHNVNSIFQVLINNDIRYFKNALDSKYDSFTVESYNDRLVYVLHSKEPIYQVIVDVKNYSVLKVRLERHLGDMFISKEDQSTRNRTDYFIKNLEFRDYKGKLYLHYANYCFFFSKLDKKTNKVIRNDNSCMELLVNDIVTDDFPSLRAKEKLGKHDPIESHLGKYNKSFWDNFNIIKHSSFDLQVIEKMNHDVKQ